MGHEQNPRWKFSTKPTLTMNSPSWMSITKAVYRLVAFSLFFVEVILMILKKSCDTILQPDYIFKKMYQKSKIPLKLCRIPKFQAIRMTIRAWKHRWVFAIYFWSHGIFWLFFVVAYVGCIHMLIFISTSPFPVSTTPHFHFTSRNYRSHFYVTTQSFF